MVKYEETAFGTVVHGMKDLLLPKCEGCEQLHARIAELEAEVSKLKADKKELAELSNKFRRQRNQCKDELDSHRMAVEMLNRTSICIEFYDQALRELDECRKALAAKG